jgi:diguanylate cyclase (GGDEF)-like protein/PAS domain S-box-containing protein
LKLEEQSQLIGLLLRDFEENASEWLWETNDMLELCRVSEHMARATDVALSALNGRSLLHLVPEDDTDFAPGGAARQMFDAMALCMAERRPFRDHVFPVRVDGRIRWWSLTGKPIVNEAGTFLGYRGVGCDVTMAKQSEERISYLARHDSLTDLPNRSLFHDTLTSLCAKPHESFAVMFLDLDGFKAINDTLGHATGDALLIAIAGRLRGCVRDGDMIARLGGDEFAVIQVGGNSETAALLGTRITTRISDTYHLNGVPVSIGVSIGITLSGPDRYDPNHLLREADLALYSAKESGRGTWRFFETEMGEKAEARHSLLADLRHAVSRGQLTLHFQPILDLDTQNIVAAEALLRWNHPTLGMIPPNDFIPLCEESGLIVPIGAWVLRQACDEAATWCKPIRVAVNLSPVQFHDPCFLLTVDEALAASGLPPDRLELEITESLFIDASQQNIEILHHLRDRGIHIALDDFGTGYSALSYLRSFPFDRVKIDRSFVRELGDNPESTAIIRAITGMAASLGMHTTAEGVETAEQATLLRDSGCGQVQGFLYSRPCPPKEVAQFIARNVNAPEYQS